MTLPNQYEDVLCAAIDTYGREAQTDVCIEECSELTKALLKYRRLPLEEKLTSKGQKVIENIQEEIADVQIMLWQMDLMYGYGYCVEDQIDKKINRLRERVGAAGKPKEEASGHEFFAALDSPRERRYENEHRARHSVTGILRLHRR